MEGSIQYLRERAGELQKELDEVNKALEAKIAVRKNELWSEVIHSLINYQTEIGSMQAIETDDETGCEDIVYTIGCTAGSPGVIWLYQD